MMDTSGRGRRKVWPEALKREIVAAASAPGASVSVVARQYDVNTNLVFTWRRLYGPASAALPAPQFLPVEVTPDPPAATRARPAGDTIEIELPGGYRVRCGCGVKGASLRIVLDTLERR
jgi:transposase